MKTLTTFALALAFSLSGWTMQAATASPPGKTTVEAVNPGGVNELLLKNMVQDQLNEKVGFPEAAKTIENQSAVNFIFRINEFNKVEVLDIYGENEALVKYVENAIDGFKIRYDNSLQGKAYRMIIDFKPSL